MSESIYNLFSKIKEESGTFCPLTAEIDVTLKCTCKCIHCYQENNHDTDNEELSTTEWLHCIDELYEL